MPAEPVAADEAPGAEEPEEAVPETRTPDHPTADASRNAVRDRLLAVLLADPDRAVGATVDLDSSQGELQRLSEAVRRERAALGAVLRRLLESGLSIEQVATLSGLPTCDVATTLGRTLDGSAEPRTAAVPSGDARPGDPEPGPGDGEAEPGARRVR
jgi:Arc/MetJ family transcription regulator